MSQRFEWSEGVLINLHVTAPHELGGQVLAQSMDGTELAQRCDKINALSAGYGMPERAWLEVEQHIVYPPAACTPPRPAAGSLSPWGVVISAEEVQLGVTYVHTLRHRGYHLTPSVNQRMPAPVRRGSGWYEGDIEGAVCAHAVPLPGADPLHVQAVLLRYYPELLTGPVDTGPAGATPPTLAELARDLPAGHRLVAVPGTGGAARWLSVAPGTALPEHAWVCPSTSVQTLAGPNLPPATRQRFEGQLTRRAQLALSATSPRFPRALRLLLAGSLLPLCLLTPPLVSAVLAVVTLGLLVSFWWPRPRVGHPEDVDVLSRRVTLDLLSDALVPFHLVVVPASDDQTATILSRSGHLRARVRADVDDSVSVLTPAGPVLLMGWAQPAPDLDHEMTLQGAVATRLMLGEVLLTG